MLKKVFLISFLLIITLFIITPSCNGKKWRSVLYPEDWTLGYMDDEGRFLHDFSYAGYHNGEIPLPDKYEGTLYNVVTQFGADNTGQNDSTSAIQEAINVASTSGGGVVFIPKGFYRCNGLLEIKSSNIVIKGEGPENSKIYFSKSDDMSDKSNIIFYGNLTRSDEIFLAQDGENLSNTVLVDDARSLKIGDEISIGWVITDEFVEEHKMTGTWYVFNGQWKPFFRREIVNIDFSSSPHKVIVDVPLRYPAKVRDKASIRKETGYLKECGIEDLSVSNAISWEIAWSFNRAHVIEMQNVKDSWIRNVHSFEAPEKSAKGYHLQSGGIKISSSKRVTIDKCRMEKAQNRGEGGNGYLFEITVSNEVLIRDSVGIAGRHNFIQNWDFGTNGCVFLRCESAQGKEMQGINDPIGVPGYCEYHHSLATACLVDQSTIKDGWFGGNRNDWSSGAGHSVTQSVYWNTKGGGVILSWQYGWGYIIGTSNMLVETAMVSKQSYGTEPKDFVEGEDKGEELEPQSLYEDQLKRRLERKFNNP